MYVCVFRFSEGGSGGSSPASGQRSATPTKSILVERKKRLGSADSIASSVTLDDLSSIDSQGVTPEPTVGSPEEAVTAVEDTAEDSKPAEESPPPEAPPPESEPVQSSDDLQPRKDNPIEVRVYRLNQPAPKSSKYSVNCTWDEAFGIPQNSVPVAWDSGSPHGKRIFYHRPPQPPPPADQAPPSADQQHSQAVRQSYALVNSRLPHLHKEDKDFQNTVTQAEEPPVNQDLRPAHNTNYVAFHQEDLPADPPLDTGSAAYTANTESYTEGRFSANDIAQDNGAYNSTPCQPLTSYSSTHSPPQPANQQISSAHYTTTSSAHFISPNHSPPSAPITEPTPSEAEDSAPVKPDSQSDAMSNLMPSHHLGVAIASNRLKEKTELQDLNNRLSSYIRTIRDLKSAGNNMDSAMFVDTIGMLEQELVNLKNLYDNQLEKDRSVINVRYC